MAGLTGQRCRFLQEKLLASGVKPGTRIPRRRWDEMLARSLGLGHVQIKNITRDGDLAGCWIRYPGHGPIQGSVELKSLSE